MHGSSLQSTESFDHEFRSHDGQHGDDRFGRVMRADGMFPLQEDGTGVEAGVDAHGGHARDRFATRNGPLNRCRPAIFRQKRCVHIQVAEFGQIDHP